MSRTIAAGVFTEVERLKKRLYRSIQTPGLNPQDTFLLLVTLLEKEFSGRDAAKAFIAFVRSAPDKGGLGLDPNQLLTIVQDLKHPQEVAPYINRDTVKRMQWMRQRIRELVLGEMPPVGGLGRPKSDDNADNISIKERKFGTDPAYTLARLKRDRPDLAAQVVKGELSANAAAVQAGFRKKRKCKCPECGYEWTP